MKAIQRTQNGFILVTGILLLIAISVVAISSMRASNLDYKMSSNTAFKAQSFEASETGRVLAGDAINKFIYERSWADLTIHASMVFDTQYDPLKENASSELPYDTSSLTKDMTFSLAKTTDRKAMNADIYIVRTPNVSAASGAGSQQLSGYRGAGKGIASSGSILYFEIRSKGLGNGNAQTITASEYRTFIQ